ncbi:MULTISPECIES: FAD-dependent oxidoreductase [Deefgea]|uniref:CoA-disulfide reductase n=1 Tax=Deefgea chitinilytica TaxID=570276 RepID=A0ABS2CB74_9NEIS|nr:MULTISPECIES: FAD-dependent oxidoreductase [Deefgea]MBM5570621.1 CoA-disulfide reductase [Deefgea chitinilytica]MBM9887850.1 FAD-dependent oxidoreductase [Deefgea sp. CFH1-16]
MNQVKQKIVIVGGVAGGASAAARVRRLSETAEIIVLERGPYVSFANCGLPYHLGGEIVERDALLLHSPESLMARFGLNVRVNHEVVSIDRAAKLVSIRNRLTGEMYSESYDSLILAPGAAPILPLLPGLDDVRVFTMRTLPDLDRLMAAMTAEIKHVSVVGAGFIGLETVEALRHRGLAVSLIERSEQVLAPLDSEMAAPLKQELTVHGVDVLLGESLAKIESAKHLTLHMESGRLVQTDLVVLAIGVKPENQLAKEAGLVIGSTGGVLVDNQQKTSDSSIYAVGDAIEVKHVVNGKSILLPLAGPANRQGRIAADVIFGRKSTYRGSQGTSVCKLFGLTAASTGLNEKTLQASGLDYRKLYIHAGDHAGYYPGASLISLKLLFAPESGQILGAQAIGEKGVDKRIDVLAVAIQAKMSVDDLAEMELAYAPPYGSAKDPVNLLGMAGQNMQSGLLESIYVEDLEQAIAGGAQVIDVRESEELGGGMIPGSQSHPLSLLRSGALTISKERPILVYCQAGLRGYIAQRFLLQNGYQVKNLNGGYLTWSMYQAARKSQR